MSESSDEISHALERGVSIRNAYFNDKDDPKSRLRPGASERDIESLEKLIGTSLSPTYREFFLISDGWDNVSATISLMSCQQIADTVKGGKFDDWFKSFWDDELGPRENALVLGHSTMTNGAYVIVLHEAIQQRSQPVDPEGEFPMVFVDESTDFTYSDFLDFLRKTEKDYSELAIIR
jgi:hypothetical protein